MANSPQTEKLQKVLARLGLGSRREMERWISQGRVKVDGKLATLGDRVDKRARLEVDGEFITQSRPAARKIILYHKVEGEVCTRHDPQGRPTVFDNLPPLHSGRWISVGRLDINTAGLLIFTNDGEFANELMHPSSELEREYLVRALGEMTPDKLSRLQKGIELEDGFARFKSIVCKGGEGANRWYRVVLTEGRNREVRRLFESQDLQISRLRRIRFGTFLLPRDLPPGEWVKV